MELERSRDRRKGLPSNGCNGLGWIKLNPEASFGSQVSGRGPGLGTSSAVFLGALQEVYIGSGATETQIMCLYGMPVL